MPSKRGGSSSRRPVSRSSSSSRSSSRPRSVSSRPVSRSTSRRSTSTFNTSSRTTRRTESRSIASTFSNRARPTVRPSRPAPRVVTRPMARPASSGGKSGVEGRSTPSARPRPGSQRIARPGSTRPTSSPTVSARDIKRKPVLPSTAPQQMGGSGLLEGLVFAALNATAAPPELASEMSSLQYSLNELQDRASFSDLEADIANLDSNLNHALNLLESARDKGYKYQKDLEEIAYDAASRWQSASDKVRTELVQQAQRVQGGLGPINNHIQRLNSSLRSVSSATSAMSGLRSEMSSAIRSIEGAEAAIEANYASIESSVSTLNSRLSTIHWMLSQKDEGKFELEKDENLYRAVKARLDLEGDDDPEGIIFLTNQRMIFERKEKVATKKILFITTASELVHEVQIAEKLADFKVEKAHNKGLFGHQDFLDLDFDNNKIGKVSLHINGQSSESWVTYLKDAKSGKIEEDIATGAGISFAEFTGDITSADIMKLQQEVNDLQDEAMLRDLNKELSELENETSSLTGELSTLRGRGYNIEKGLESDIVVLATQWEKIKQRAQLTLETQTKFLAEQMGKIQTQMAAIAGKSSDLAAARPLYMSIKSSIASLEAQIDAAEETVYDQYDEYADEVETMHAHFEWIDWMLDALDTASFKLLATESGVAAVEAVWERPSLDPENGILFLTDQRFIWEDRVGEYEVKFNVPFSQVNEVKEEVDEESGMETLVADLSGDAPVHVGRFAFSQSVVGEWVKMVGRAKSGGYAEDRAVEISESELERIRNAPTQCGTCNAAFTAPVLRGQTEIVCEYCGTTTRI